MSGSESEALSAIVVGSPKGASEAITVNESTKMCSSCRHEKTMSHFIGLSSRHKGQEMRTCTECRIKNTRTPVKRYKKRAKRFGFENSDVQQSHNNRTPRRLGTSKKVSSAAVAVNKPSTRAPITTNRPSTATYGIPPKTRKHLAVGFSTPGSGFSTPGSAATVPGPAQDGTDEEYYQPPLALGAQSLKRQSTPSHLVGEHMDQEAIQVQQPPKRQRITAASAIQRAAEGGQETEVEADEEMEDNEPLLNASGHLVGSDLAAFAASLGRLSQLLVSAGNHLDHERIGALESEIHHDWRVDEMATFVEGFLKGASANTVGKGW